ncbi:Carbon starvation protein A [Pseudobythopirellula maris]|uniref:Carbon starvation protein A n=1 Tax=Pseudobythopirellula maris TaxID=2527991 RepID=A0A5C5ZMK1_9BACT|nr:carbon starvation protein A [Pseudobythopirellula maris]TWT88388.1 Carbon starvation protein A [Pseudobythopirellula maris]
MLTLVVAIGSFAALGLAYRVYGGWLARRVFRLDPLAKTPSHELRDDVDFVPTRRSVVLGHHFTSIAGTGPIVGPAIAVFWGWLPALLWVVLGSIFVGAVHDFGSLVVSLRSRGQTVGEAAGRLISPRARLLFLLVLFFALTVVIGVFGLVIAAIFAMYPESVLSVWTAMPLALAIGYLVHRRGAPLLPLSLAALGLVYLAVWLGVYVWPITLPSLPVLGAYGTPIVLWTAILLVYCYAASVLPVWLLLQPRDYLNSQQLLVAVALLVGGLAVACATGAADLNAAPAIAQEVPADAPPIWPFLFITIACGACSGFHCLVASGTTSKQVDNEQAAQAIGYGAMLMEGGLAVLVILACCAGLGMGVPGPDGEMLTGRQAWESRYQAQIITVTTDDGAAVTTGGWKSIGLKQKVGAFVEGGANFVAMLGLPRRLCVAIIAVLVACFAATTLDTATRLQRYVIQELAHTLRLAPLQGKHGATSLAVIAGGAVAMIPGPGGPGTGGLILWPLFGATNQLLAGLALMVVVFYLARRGLPLWFAVGPMLLMLVMPGWAMAEQIAEDFWPNRSTAWPLLLFGVAIMALQLWMVVEALLAWPRARGVLEAPAAAG